MSSPAQLQKENNERLFKPIRDKHGSLNTYDKGCQKDFEEFVCHVVIVQSVYEGEQGMNKLWPMAVTHTSVLNKASTCTGHNVSHG